MMPLTFQAPAGNDETYSLAKNPPSGYKARFVTSLLKRHECPICLCAMRDPVQTECGHLFCKGCLEPVLEGPNPVCPIEKTKISRIEVYPDNACKREILSLKVYCDASNNGCPWIGTLKELEAHSQVCDYGNTLCRQCGLNVRSKTLTTHQTKECPMRLVQCQFCGKMVPKGQTEAHIESVCPEYLRPCPNVCVPTSQFRLHQLETHLDPRSGDCPLAEVPCPFKPYGCTFVSERKKILSHLDEYKLQHAYLQTDYLKTMMEQVSKNTKAIEHLTGHVSAVEAHIDSIVSLLDGLLQRIEMEDGKHNSMTGHTDQNAYVTSQHEKLTKFQAIIMDCGQKSNTKKEPIKFFGNIETSENGSTHIAQNSLYNRIKTAECGFDRCLSSCLDLELRLQLLERATYNGVLLWKIDDFGRRRKEAVDGVTMSLYSIPFYTSRHGYKMCARVYLNGDGMGKGTHLSLFFVVMKGPFDALLSWPFKQKVTMTIINQAGKKHVTDTFRPDSQSNSFHRPTLKEMNVASGCPMFVRLEHLLNGGFVKDDCIFLRVVVDIADIVSLQ